MGYNYADGAEYQVLPVLEDAIVTALAGGQHVPIPVGSPLPSPRVFVDPDVDIWVKASNAPTTYQVTTGYLGGGFEKIGTLAAQTGLDFGTTGPTLEAWVTVEAGTATTYTITSMGDGTATYPRIVFQVVVDASDQLEIKLVVEDDSDTRICDTCTTGALTDYLAGDMLRHLVAVCDRTNDAVYFYIDGTLVGTDSANFTDSVNDVSISGATGAASRITFGVSGAGSAAWDGNLLALRTYVAELTLAQVRHRTGRGPNVLPSDGVSPSWYIDVAERGSWSDPDLPEAWDASGTLLTTFALNGFANLNTVLAAINGNAVASEANSIRVLANIPKVLAIGAAKYLNVFSRTGDAGDVRIIDV